MNTICPNIEPAIPIENYEAILVIEDALPSESIGRIAEHASRGTSIIVLKERAERDTPWPTDTLKTPDFTTALYFAAWAAGEALSPGMP